MISSRSRVAKSSSEPMTAQALSRSNPPANTEHRSSNTFSASPVNLSTVPSNRCTTAAQRLARSAMISRSRSVATAEAMPIERTTSANSTVTCLYSAWVAGSERGEPQPRQNRAFSSGSVPHVRHAGAAVIRPSAASGPRGPSSPA